MDLAGIMAARAAGRPLSDLLAERITGPLGMTSTGFQAGDAGRLATAYVPGPAGLEVLDLPDGAFARAPHFEELSSGLVSTASDLLGFFAALADGGGPLGLGRRHRHDRPRRPGARHGRRAAEAGDDQPAGRVR